MKRTHARAPVGALVLASMVLAATPGGGCATTLPEPSAMEAEASRVTVQAEDGLSIRVVDHGPPPEVEEAAPAPPPTLVLLHGWACDRAFWGVLPERLGRDHRVVTLDLPGHGESGTDRERWSVVGLGSDVRVVCDALALEDVVLVGHSMGAVVALAAAAELGGRVRGVVAVDSLHALGEPFPEDTMEALVGLFEDDWSGSMEASVRSMVPAARGDALPDWILARARRSDRRAALGLMRSFVGVDLAHLVEAAGVPVRAVNAAPWRGGAETELARNRALADYDAVLVDGVGHYLQLERPGAVEAALRGFLAELDPPR